MPKGINPLTTLRELLPFSLPGFFITTYKLALFVTAMNNAKEELTLLIKQFTAGLEHAQQQAAAYGLKASTEMPPIQTVDLNAFANSGHSIDYQLAILQQKLTALLKHD